MYIGRQVRVIRKRGGRGDITYYVNIPKDYQQFLGFPDKYAVMVHGDALLYIPVKEIVIEETTPYSLDYFEKKYKKLSKRKKPVKLYTGMVLLRNLVLQEGVQMLVVFCDGHKYARHGFIEYRKNSNVVSGLCCGCNDKCVSSTIGVISTITQNSDNDTLKKLERLLRDEKLRGKAVVVEFLRYSNLASLHVVGK